MKKLFLLCMMALMLAACDHPRQEKNKYKYQCDISYTVQDNTGQTFTTTETYKVTLYSGRKGESMWLSLNMAQGVNKLFLYSQSYFDARPESVRVCTTDLPIVAYSLNVKKIN